MENDTKNWVNIPNCLTIFRLLLIPVFLIAYYQLPEKRYVSLIVFATASFTDMLDGIWRANGIRLRRLASCAIRWRTR